MKSIELIINETDIPGVIKDNILEWKSEKETDEFIFLSPDFGPIEPCIGQPFLLVIDKMQSLGNIYFLGTPEWDELNLNYIYKEITG